ncbi:DNA repair protein rad51c [Ancistrocladus abbreviatus]
MEALRLPISASQRRKLTSAGYTSLSSLSSVTPSELARDLKVSELEAQEILKVASHASRADKSDGNHPIINGAQNVWDMLNEEDLLPRITTSCTDLDSILGGGISCKEVTELGGVPGIVDYGGLGGKAVYIDTEGSFMVERVLQIAEGCMEDMMENNYNQHRDFQTSHDKLQPKNFLANIFYFRICSYTEQIGLINYLDKFVSEHKEVKIVVIDSVTFHFRQDFEDLALRTRLLSGMALKLMKLAHKFNMAVVLLNQVTTKYTEGSYQLTLALGDSWAHASTNRVILHWNGNERYAYIDKSPSLPSASAPYAVTTKGIRNSTTNCKRIKLM